MKKTIEQWSVIKRDWITSNEIDQSEELTEEQYNEAIATWRAMGVAEDYNHQDGCYSNMCKHPSYCRCTE